MRKSSISLAILLFCTSATSMAVDPDANKLREQANSQFKVIPTAEQVIADKKLTVEQIDLGKQLFFEPRLSKSQIISCNSCHSLGTGGSDNIRTSIGHGWQKGPRNSPTVLNAVFNGAQFWDGRAKDLAEQAKGPVQASVEMNATPKYVEDVLRSIPEYSEMFKKAFPGTQHPISFDNMAKALEAFESTLVTPHSKFDQFLTGKNTLNNLELKGMEHFMNKGCVACHSGINVGGQGYFPFGVVKKPGADILPVSDRGRYMVTKTATDDYVFRAGPLRNIALTPPYFHSGEVWDLEEAVAIMGTSQLGTTLAEDEIKAITAFLHTLTGEQPKVEYPTLPRRRPQTPKPGE